MQAPITLLMFGGPASYICGPYKVTKTLRSEGRFKLHPNFEVRKWEEEASYPTGNIRKHITRHSTPCPVCGETPDPRAFCWLCTAILRRRK